jgi:hypothetical protein
MAAVAGTLTVMELLNSGFATNLAGGLGKGLGTSAPAGPSNAQSGAYGSGLDASGWNVNFSGVQSAASNQDKSGGIPGIGVSGVASSVPWYVWAVLAGAVAWKLYKKSK